MKLLLMTFIALNFLVMSANANTKEKSLSYNPTYLLSFDDLMSLSESQKRLYLRKVAFRLSIIDKAIADKKNRESKRSVNILELLFLEKAYASDLRCIGGGIFVPSSTPTCGVRSHAGYTCPQGQEICNPLLFGVRDNNTPVCHETASTKWCFKNTKPGFTTRLDLVFQKEEARSEWNRLSENIDEICVQANRQGIEEVDSRVNSACADILDQKALNTERIESGRIDTNFSPLTSQSEATSGVCIDCLSNAPVIDPGISELVSAIPARTQQAQENVVDTAGVSSPVTDPIGWDAASLDHKNGRCAPQKNNLRRMERPSFPSITTHLVSSINNTLQNSYGVSPVVFNRALAFYQSNKDNIKNSRYITVVDMSKHSSQKRKFLIDLETGSVEGYYVAHGRGSDPNSNRTGNVQEFSNADKSNKTPEGFHLTGQLYNGRYGSSLTLHGQEEGVNDNSCGRAIVIHRAIGNGGIASSNRSSGNSWRSNGCFAMNENETQSFINRTQNGSVYYVHSGN